MAVDHGLGGKDNKKSKEKRAKKHLKTKKIAQAALTGGKKRAVVFDEQSRQDYLTGFHQRKQERRKFGLTMQVLKDKKKRRTAKADARNYIKTSTEADEKSNKLNTDNNNDEDNDEEEEEEGEEVNNTKIDKEEVFTDDFTQNMFGGTVSITINEIEV